MQLLGVARRNGASLGEETLDSLIATNIQVDHDDDEEDNFGDDGGDGNNDNDDNNDDNFGKTAM